MPHKPQLYLRWAAEVRRMGIFRPGERIGVAVSGGPDSVLLLHFMKQLAGELGLTLAVVHFNHRLRGPASDADERFVADLARDLGLQLMRGEADVEHIAREKRRNLEAVARELRYRFFFSLVDQGQLDRVATAHTADDQAETVLLRILRGTGTRGLAGIYQVLDAKVLRPFLGLTRPEVEAELRSRGLGARLDESNLDPRLRRNKVRRKLLPLLRKEFNPQIVPLLKELADRAREDEEFLEQQARERAHAWRVREGQEEKIPVRALVEFPPAIARRVLRQMLLAARGSLRRITHAHIEALRRLAVQGQSGKTLLLPGDLSARKEFSWLVVGPRAAGRQKGGFAYPVQVPGEVFVPELDQTFRFKIVGPGGSRRAYNGRGLPGLDTQKVRGKLVLRSWRAGDHFRPHGSRKSLKLKELFRRQRIPQGQRSVWPVLEGENEILWVRGWPAATSVAASPEAEQVVVIVEESGVSGRTHQGNP